MDTEKPTVIDTQAEIEGKLKGRDVHILGRFQGEIDLSGRLLLGEGARVEARVQADHAEIAGQFNGELKVRSLVLLEKARVEGTLEAQSLAVREGAQLNGAVNSGAGRGEGRPEPGRRGPDGSTQASGRPEGVVAG